MKIGVLALQGDFVEHLKIISNLGAVGVQVRLPEDLEGLDGLIIPGGESTTMGKLANTYALTAPLKDFAAEKPMWGTCAGMIFLAKDIGAAEPHLAVMDIVVERNAFGRQVDSFEIDLTVPALDNGQEQPFKAVFIRAPRLASVNEEAGVRILASLDDGTIVAAQQGHLLATAFHPELTGDVRFHQYFLELIDEASA